MRRQFFVLTLLAAQVAWAGFEAEPAIRKAYDHIVFKYLTPYRYQKKIADLTEPFVAIHEESDGKRNEMRLLHHGAAAMYKRLEMMDRARTSIEMEYFIYSPNKRKPKPTEVEYEVATKIINNKLIEKAIQGVKVRLLVDGSVTVWQFNDDYASASKEAVRRGGGDPKNFQVRYYNVGRMTGKYSQFRSHRKLLVIDDQEAVTGGRNIEDKYFDLDHQYNFLDRDIWVRGSVVAPMRASFDAFWNAGVTWESREAKPPRLLTALSKKSREKRAARLRAAAGFTVYTDHDRAIEARIRELGERLYGASEAHACPKAVFVSDRPLDSVLARWCINGKFCRNGYKESYRFVERALGEYISRLTSEDELVVDSPYFMLNTRSGSLLKRLSGDKVKMTVFTNSLGSTDAVYVSSAWYHEVHELVRVGVKAYVHGSKAEPGYPTIDESVSRARWGTHSKTLVFGDDAFFVGTYNIDNRSSFYNAEMGLICEGSKALAADVRENILSRLRNSAYRVESADAAIGADGRRGDALGGASEKQRKLMDAIRVPVEMLQFLM